MELNKIFTATMSFLTAIMSLPIYTVPYAITSLNWLTSLFLAIIRY